MQILLNEAELLEDFQLSRAKISQIFQKAAQLILPASRKNSKISVIFVSASYIKELNRKFRQVNEVTDVMAFPFFEKNLWGEIYICLGQALENSREYSEKLEVEVARLFIHGLLHLLGFRDRGKSNFKKMWQKQEFFLKKVLTGGQ